MAVASETAWQRLLDDLRWDARIDTLSAVWAAGEGEAHVECFGALGALASADEAGDVLADYRD